MRKCKRIVSAMLAVSMVMGMTAFPALAEPLGIQGESRVETGITAVSYTHLDVYKRQVPGDQKPWSRSLHRFV